MVEWFKAPVLKADVVYSYRGFESLLIQMFFKIIFKKLKLFSFTINRINLMLKLILICILFNTIDYCTFLFIWGLRLSDFIAFFCGVNNEWSFLLDMIEFFLGINILSLLIPEYSVKFFRYWINYFFNLSSDFNSASTMNDPNPTGGPGSNISNSGASASNNSDANANNNNVNISHNNGVNASNNSVVNDSGANTNNNVVGNNGNNLNSDSNEPSVLFDITSSVLNAPECTQESKDEEEKEGEESD